jgi:hypothetical protein
MTDWKNFFPFETGEVLAVDGPLWYDGSGSVVKNDGTSLQLNLAMPAVHLFGYRIPELKASFSIEAVQDGPGNKGRAVMDDVVVEDDNIDVSSIERANRRIVDFSKKVQGKHLDVIIQRVNDHRVDLTIQGHDFTVTKVVE